GKGDAIQAFDAQFRAFTLSPHRSMLGDLVRLADAAEGWETVAQALAGAISRRKIAREVLRELWWRVAVFHRDRRGDAAAAEAAIERALAIEPKDVDLLDALVALQRRAPGTRLVATLLRRADATGG